MYLPLSAQGCDRNTKYELQLEWTLSNEIKTFFFTSFNVVNHMYFKRTDWIFNP